MRSGVLPWDTVNMYGAVNKLRYPNGIAFSILPGLTVRNQCSQKYFFWKTHKIPAYSEELHGLTNPILKFIFKIPEIPIGCNSLKNGATPVLTLYNRHDLKKGGFLPLDRAIHTPQKRGCCKPAKLQGQKHCKSAQC